jgi:hypothetical protein
MTRRALLVAVAFMASACRSTPQTVTLKVSGMT